MEYLVDPAEEERDSALFWFKACEYLLDYLGKDNRLRTTPFYDKLSELVGFWREEILDPGNTREAIENAAPDLFYFGTVGKAIGTSTKRTTRNSGESFCDSRRIQTALSGITIFSTLRAHLALTAIR